MRGLGILPSKDALKAAVILATWLMLERCGGVQTWVTYRYGVGSSSAGELANGYTNLSSECAHFPLERRASDLR